MHGYAIGRNKHVNIAVAVLLGIVSALAAWPHAVSAQSMVQAVICGTGAEITMTSPQSDSVVTSPTIPIKGTVKQAGQIEVMIDGAFNGVIPLNASQTSYESDVQITAGTHTVTVTAIDSCGSTNASVSTVVTFTPPPTNGSVGYATPTNVSGVVIGTESAENKDSSQTVQEFNPGGLLPAPLVGGLNGVLNWLNVSSSDHSHDGMATLSITRALVMTLGIYMAVIGVAQSVVSLFASAPFFHKYQGSTRTKIAGRTLRGVGIILVIAAFLV